MLASLLIAAGVAMLVMEPRKAIAVAAVFCVVSLATRNAARVRRTWAGGDAVSTRPEQSAPTAPRIVGTTLRATPSLVEIRLANENDAATGRHATITDVDFSVGLVKQRVRWRSLMVSLAVIHCTLTAGAAGKISAIWRMVRPCP